MYGDFFLLEREGHPVVRAQRLPLGNTAGRSETWLRDTLVDHPQILPIDDIEPSFGPLIPLCRELRTSVGPVDIAFICPSGKLTLVECKLWRNPEARRSVVAQILDYASAIKRWSYSDLQRQVAIATGRQGNVPFELAKTVAPQLAEHDFVDSVSRSIRGARFLLLVAGDGIREDVGAMAELLNAEIGSSFAFGMLEIALHDLGNGGVAVQPRVVTKTQIIERHIVMVRSVEGEEPLLEEEDSRGDVPLSHDQSSSSRRATSIERQTHSSWWQPIVSMSFDDPDQQPPRLYWKNNVRTSMPWPGTWLTAWMSQGPSGVTGIALSGHEDNLDEFWRSIRRVKQEIQAELPDGANVDSGRFGIQITRPNTDFHTDDEKRAWMKEKLNQFVNVLRPRMKALLEG